MISHNKIIFHTSLTFHNLHLNSLIFQIYKQINYKYITSSCIYSLLGFETIFQAPIKYLNRINKRSLPICNQLQTGTILDPEK